MTITTRDQLINGMANNSDRVVWNKASIAGQVVGGFASLWRATGVPGQGDIPTSAAACTKDLVGAIRFTNQVSPVTSYYAWQTVSTGNAATTVEIHDRLVHMGGLSGAVTTAQTVGADLATLAVPAARLGDNTSYSDVQWWLEWYTATGSTAVTATVEVTYNDGTTGNVAVSLAASMAAGRMLPIVPAVAGKFIKGVNSVTLSATTGTAGNFGVTATRPRTTVNTGGAVKAENFDWAQLGLPEIPNDSCLFLIVVCSTTSTGTVRGQGKIAHG